MTGPIVVTCHRCAGTTVTEGPCGCLNGGNRLLVTDDPVPREAYRECRMCGGSGRVATACHTCGQRGRQRAQIVLTVANVDTGAVASTSVEPGTVAPVPDIGGGWRLRLGPLVCELAATVGAATWSDVWGRPDGELDVSLPRDWRPDLPLERWRALEAAAIAAQAGEGWHLYLGRSIAAPPVDPERRLGELCAVADLLCLDLVVEARRNRTEDQLYWNIRYDVPGARVPARPRLDATSLALAATAATVLRAIGGISARGLTAPAHYLHQAGESVPVRAHVNLDELERRVVADCTDLRTGLTLPGAQAIWRDGRWWHTSLRVTGHVESLSEQQTGQIVRRVTPVLERGWEPPAPTWLGEPIEYSPCPDCDPGSRLRACLCTLGGSPVDADCGSCGGAGVRALALPCHTCGDSHRIHSGVVVTITDLGRRVEHLRWRAGEVVPSPQVATHPNGKPLVQLPDRYRLDAEAGRIGVRPEDLTELDGGWPVDQDLREGLVTLHRSDVDGLTQFVARAGRGHPGARLLVLTAPPDVPSLAELVRLAVGLGLGLVVTLRDNRINAADPTRVHGISWHVEFTPADPPTVTIDPPTRPSLAAAVAYSLEYLETALAEEVPTDPAQPIPAPQCAEPTTIEDPERLIRRLAARHGGEQVSVHFGVNECHVYLREQDDLRPLATGRDVIAAFAALGVISESSTGQAPGD
ncbi:hypothetical protein [Micromonospora sp. NBC_01796]|uniref:hypothetical protein n=1 Tax=Micromonospora sp. NBC_01796 TaxID=2975987 RepID=UPI002DD9FB5C|nr:hypothetical protein [Micromonospora sp. NBC_01796]WSA87954.1 hypothetical protein OIE47_10285 [Micromonospora sp. NBC_01796]